MEKHCKKYRHSSLTALAERFETALFVLSVPVGITQKGRHIFCLSLQNGIECFFDVPYFDVA